MDSSIEIRLVVYKFQKKRKVEEEIVTLELVPENEDQKLPKKPQIESCIT